MGDHVVSGPGAGFHSSMSPNATTTQPFEGDRAIRRGEVRRRGQCITRAEAEKPRRRAFWKIDNDSRDICVRTEGSSTLLSAPVIRITVQRHIALAGG